ncbi:SDR family NAD(P)-dependent oxidoreductase [Streptomyces sp. NPDC003006]
MEETIRSLSDQTGVGHGEEKGFSMGVRGSVVVITGASSGIGPATAVAFSRKGCSVVLAARRAEALEAVRQECERRHGAQALVVPTDVTDPKAVDDLARRGVERFGRIRIAGSSVLSRAFSVRCARPMVAMKT